MGLAEGIVDLIDHRLQSAIRGMDEENRERIEHEPKHARKAEQTDRRGFSLHAGLSQGGANPRSQPLGLAVTMVSGTKAHQPAPTEPHPFQSREGLLHAINVDQQLEQPVAEFMRTRSETLVPGFAHIKGGAGHAAAARARLETDPSKLETRWSTKSQGTRPPRARATFTPEVMPSSWKP